MNKNQLIAQYHSEADYSNLVSWRRYALVWEYLHMTGGRPGAASFQALLKVAMENNWLSDDAKIKDRNLDKLVSPSPSGCPFWVVRAAVSELFEMGWRPWLDAHWANMTKAVCLGISETAPGEVAWKEYEQALPSDLNRRVAKYWFEANRDYALLKRKERDRE